jgi:predicted secreted Zn-dependent protease
VCQRLNIGQLVTASALLFCACNGPPIVVPTPPPAEPAVALTPAGRAVLALANTAPTLPANVQVHDDTTRYSITGSNIGEIARQLGVGRNSDSDYVGATATRVQWQFVQQRHEDTCAIGSVLVRIEIQTRIPQWIKPPSATDLLSAQWTAFVHATERHENGHRNIALHTAVAIAQALSDEHGLACNELDQFSNAGARGQWELGNQHQLTYDATTLHGETQGSRWPPFLDRP